VRDDSGDVRLVLDPERHALGLVTRLLGPERPTLGQLPLLCLRLTPRAGPYEFGGRARGELSPTLSKALSQFGQTSDTISPLLCMGRSLLHLRSETADQIHEPTGISQFTDALMGSLLVGAGKSKEVVGCGAGYSSR
jgi:hypothetical protein